MFPHPYDASKRYPMIVEVHGGPAAETRPAWPRPGLPMELLSSQGYFLRSDVPASLRRFETLSDDRGSARRSGGGNAAGVAPSGSAHGTAFLAGLLSPI